MITSVRQYLFDNPQVYLLFWLIAPTLLLGALAFRREIFAALKRRI